MHAGRKRPISVVLCDALIRATAHVTPANARDEWIESHLAGTWHRWQFLEGLGVWGWREAFGLVRSCSSDCAQAVWFAIASETIRRRIREFARSPWTYLGVLAALLGLLALLTAGLPATRQL
ncbi:MAG: hypothetical protein JO091_07395, partial [Acidobacteriaceae bacterium]|nr:hypothetical protein [Acidobacteriaceae bacterium]